MGDEAQQRRPALLGLLAAVCYAIGVAIARRAERTGAAVLREACPTWGEAGTGTLPGGRA